MNIYESINRGFGKRYHLNEAEEGRIIDGNQWVAYWTPHNGFGDVSAARDVAVGKLKDILEDGETRNVVLQGTKGSAKVKRIGDIFYDMTNVLSKGRLATNARVEKFKSEAERRGFIFDEEATDQRGDPTIVFKFEDFIPGYDASLEISTTSRPNSLLRIKKDIGTHKEDVLIARSESSIPGKVWADMENSMKIMYNRYDDLFHSYNRDHQIDIDDLPDPSTFPFFNF